MRKPATNINEFVNNLLLGALDKEEEIFYVPLYEEKMAEIEDRLIYDEIEQQTIYLLGQVGTGKTTALNFLANNQITNSFEVVRLYATQLFDMNDIDIADVLLVLAHELIRRHPALKKPFLSKLEGMAKQYKGLVTKEKTSESGYKAEGGGGVEVSVNLNPIRRFLEIFNVRANLLADVRMDSGVREMVREVFNVNAGEIFKLTNEIIQKFETDKLKGKKKLLLIFNELDHMRNADKIHQLFIDNKYYLENLACKKVISVPLVLMTLDQFNAAKTESQVYIGLKLKSNPIAPTKNYQEEIEQNKQLLREIVHKRIAADVDLIAADALEKAIEKSGGIVRQFINIISFAGRKVRRLKGTKISLPDVEFGIDRARQELETSLIGRDRIALLAEVHRHNSPSPEKEELLVHCLQSNQILAYHNSPNWYMLNPLIEETVQIYAKSIEKQ